MPPDLQQDSGPDPTAQHKYDAAIVYIRAKIDQLLTLMGTLPLRPEELDDATLIELDPIGIVAGAFEQVLAHIKQTNHELTIARNEIRSVFDSFGAAVVVVSNENRVNDCNLQAAEWLFHTSDTALIKGRLLSEVCTCHAHFSKAELGIAQKVSEFDYENRYYHLVRTAIYDEENNLQKHVYMCFDITAQKDAERILATQATTDELTGIANRRQFDAVVKSEILRAERYRVPLGVIMFDIDHFKEINDIYGHQAGDDVLVRLSKLVVGMIRGADFFARWGGEEFVILAPSRDIRGTRQFAEKLRSAMESHAFPLAAKITCSFGLSEFKPGDSIESLFRRVDSALYKAKENGRNRVETT